MLATIVAPAAVGQESDAMFVSSAAAAPQKPIIAVPLFTNKTTGHSGQTNEGERQLPDSACEIATDAATSAIVSTRRFRVLSRSTPALKAVDSEILYQGTGGTLESTQIFSSLKSCNAKYLLLGRLNRFRVDRTEGVAYGVKRRQIVTSVSVDMQLVDVNSMDIIAGETATERIVVRLPEGVTTHTAVYDWEPVLREAISRCVPKFLGKMTVSAAAPDELETAAPMVDVQVTSTPEGADVEFNGNFVGNTPCTISVPAEIGVISISAAGYEKWAKRIKPSANLKIAPKLKEEKVEPAPAPATPSAKEIIIIE
jgi:curli biogenesis system outer membrane secretion channel CsgG